MKRGIAAVVAAAGITLAVGGCQSKADVASHLEPLYNSRGDRIQFKLKTKDF